MNPGYDWEHNPNLQPEYTNPVTLNNKLVYFANAYVEVTRRLGIAYKLLAEIKLAKHDAESALKDFEAEILNIYIPTSSERQNNRVLDSFISRSAATHEATNEYIKLINAVREQEKKLIAIAIRIDYYNSQKSAIELAGTHIQTHLSFVKSEQRQSRSFT